MLGVNILVYFEYLRRQEGLTQKQVADITGIDKSYVSKAERHGKAYPKHLQLFARALQFDGDPEKLMQEVSVNVPE